VQPSRVPQESRESAPAFYRRRRRRDNEIGQVLLRKGMIKPEQLRLALRVQAETGGHLGAVLKRMGACDSRAIADALIEQVRGARSHNKTKKHVKHSGADQAIDWLKVDCRPELVNWLLVLIDVLALSVGGAIVWFFFAREAPPVQQYCAAALVPLCVVWNLSFGLYAVTPLSPPDEIRSAVAGVSLGYAACWAVIKITQDSSPTLVTLLPWIGAWFVSVILSPAARGLVRSIFSKRAWWGHAVVVLGAGKVGRAVVTLLRSRPQLGLKPVAILDDDPSRQGTVRATWGDQDIVIQPVRGHEDEDFNTPSARGALEQFSEVEDVPVLGGFELAPALQQRLGLRTAVLAMPEMNAAATLGLIERFVDGYTNVLVIPELFNLAHFGAPTRYLGGALGIEVRRQLLLRGPRAAKRTIDIVLTSIGLLLILPILVAVAILIALDSRGSVFYLQKRLGQDGVRFRALKFRTMYQDAERRLTELLARDQNLRIEYEQFHKLTDDPRVTRIGRFLRKYSVDELPQLWNVVVGDMSLVGPRPYLEREIPDMEQKEAIILRVKPGITGIWQVTWRNESTFEQRVQLDVEYVRNWSPWLDIYILARTVPVVLGGTGS
jgi:lipopolysaccharide/colanic/teichoic acid biosynthesis glycosyltransferase